MESSDSSLANRILIGLLVGIGAGIAALGLGHFFPTFLTHTQQVATQVLDPLGQIFLRILFFVVVPLVFTSLTAGVVQLGSLSKLGPLAGRTFSLFALNMSVGVALGLVMMNTVRPGERLKAEDRVKLMSEFGGKAEQQLAVRAAQPAASVSTLVEMFMPKNLIGAVAGQSRTTLGDVLPLIVFALLVGAAGTQLDPGRRAQLQSSLELVSELMTRIVHFALRLAPYAVPAMIFSVIVKIGIGILVSLLVFVLGCVGVMALHLFGTMSVWLIVWARRSPLKFFKSIEDVLITAFSTSSSNATLPAALSAARERLDVSSSTAGFVLPLGTTMNMSGTALYEGCVVLFVAQVYGVNLSVSQQIVLLLLSVLSAVAVAGIPGGSLPLIAGLLVNFNIPPEGLGIILGADRILDMCRTTVNVGCDLVTAVIVDAQVKRAELERPSEV